ncbi:MAG: hypothetical protein LN566_06250 [Rickettsia endosymbiont of Stiretrus anchorago]|nr:hypothetical protein [Rickettsia endosymbiont of Stiretrus anchorago]
MVFLDPVDKPRDDTEN